MTAARKRLTFLVTVDQPEGATVVDICAFIEDSLLWAGGCRSPDDPMFYSLENITVKRAGSSA